ncbi:complement C3-like isoform X2 [Sardina pilchardus]|uniref:complement C3-like isoform X2 n=1 Tax=Sardina pilchardus TaxID=27697 RepID=UPI002E14C6C1
MRVDLVVVCVAAVALSLPALSTCDPLYVLSAPSILRVGTPEKVFVEAQDYAGGDQSVKITVMNYPKKNVELTSTTVTLNEANRYMLLADITIPGGKDHFVEDDSLNQYVYLEAKFPVHTLEKVVLVSFQSGYIFVQTDKTIYTPSSTVMYRVFSLSPAMQPVESGISVEIMTPDGITLTKDVFFPTRGVMSGEHKLPEVVSLGIWKVVTRFQSTPQRNFTAEFEVKEYVLPSFEVLLTTAKPFFYVDDKELTVDIVARYLYKKDVTGVGFVSFGVLTKENEKRNLASSLQRVEICDGKAKAVLKKEHITQSFTNINDLVGSSIYVTVGVLTKTGSEMVEAEKRGIQIVKSPYTIHFKKMAKYFKPGMPFAVSVFVANPDGSPAGGIAVEVKNGIQVVSGMTNSAGMARVTINTLDTARYLSISVTTKDPRLQSAQQGQKSLTVNAYETHSGNYLHIGVGSTELTIGDQFKVNFNLAGRSSTQNQELTYLILNKGQLVKAEKFKRQGQALVTVSLPVTKEMVPSFRIVAYYHVGSSEVVSDSVWVDVKDTCMGTLKMEGSRPGDVYSPRQKFSLKISGDPGARVGLVAVDKGVYVLNNKHRLTQSKIWDVVEKHDTACTSGSGQDSMWVFYDAGLVFRTNHDSGTHERSGTTCTRPAKKLPVIVKKVMPVRVEVRPALRARVELRRMSSAVFHVRQPIMQPVEVPVEVPVEQPPPTAEEDDDDFYVESEDISSRSQFPESWLWEEEDLPECPAENKLCTTTSLTKTSHMKDSITSWQVMSIGVSKTHGICVAEPYEMVVKKDFFIDLKLPYSAVRNEQIEIKAVLYNYMSMKMKVRVEIMETKDVCSVATKKGKYRTTIEMDPMTSRAVPFIIIPMQRGKHTIEVKAAVYDEVITDGVKKDLLVVAEGMRSEMQVAKVVLNPSKHGGTQVENIISQVPRKQVPGTPANTYFTVSANQISQTIEKAITGDSLGSLIVQPRGCGEQNMIYMTLPLIATHYLDTTNQWEKVGLEKRATAIKYIKMGYQQELAFRKPDGAFSVWADKPGSAWLTAYVAKVFAMTGDLISIEEKVVCEALKWLVLNSQMPDGIFKETFNVYHAEMVGDVRGSDADASMTAFVLIAMQEGSEQCSKSVTSLPESMKKATEYLEGRLKTLSNPYAVAMVSYALANVGKLNQEVLLKHAFEDRTHWPVKSNKFFTLEATAYALLALVKAKEFEKAAPIVKWLNEQQFYGGGYGSTQSTIMVFQAVAEYAAQVKQQQQDLDVEIQVSGRSAPIRWTIDNSNAYVTRSGKADLNQNLKVNATGTGEATLSVMTLYYAMPEEVTSECTAFDLKVKLDKQDSVTYPGAKESYMLTIDILYLSKERDSTMSILDISILTGFVVDETDLTKLSRGADRFIQRFEMDKMLSEKGSLILYMDQVSRTTTGSVAFRIHKVMEVGLLQPAAVSVYEYLDMENRCVKFYHPVKIAGELNRLCQEDLCQCAEEGCCVKKSGSVKATDRSHSACAHGIDYVYKITVEKMDLTHHTDVYHMKVNYVIKEGTDFGVEGHMREFVAHPNCRSKVALQQGKSYLIMGHRDDVVLVGSSYKYLLGHVTWLEYWPTEEEAQTPEHADTFAAIELFSHEVTTLGCSI